MKLPLILTALVGAAAGGTAWADGDCPRPPKRKPPTRPVRPKPPKPPPQDPCVVCVQEPGPPGPKGDPGETTVVHRNEELRVTVQQVPAINLRLGVIGTLQLPHGDWAWGPALQLASELSDSYELTLTGGIAAGASAGRESGHILGIAVQRKLRDSDVGLSLGLQYVSIDGSRSNGSIDGSYLNLMGGVVYQGDHLRIEVGPTLGGLRDDSEPGTQPALGAHASAFLGWSW